MTVLRRRTVEGRFARDLRAAVAEARACGMSWEHIGGVLDLTADEARRRYGRKRPLRGTSDLLAALAQRMTA